MAKVIFHLSWESTGNPATLVIKTNIRLPMEMKKRKLPVEKRARARVAKGPLRLLHEVAVGALVSQHSSA